jgi:hypothetical protein
MSTDSSMSRWAMGRKADRSWLTAPAMRAAPPETEKLVDPPESFHGPPMSAVPKSSTTVRPNRSPATSAGAVPVTVTFCVVVLVSPRLSVTVIETGYVPAAL